MSFSRKAAFASSTLVLLLCGLILAPCEARADAVAITNGSFNTSSPFLPPRYIGFGFNLQTSNFTAVGGSGGHLDDPTQQVGTNCVFPCVAGSTFSLSSTNHLFTFSPAASHLEIGGQTRFGWFLGSSLQFDTDSFTIPLDAGGQVELTASFTMTGTVGFSEVDLQSGAFTGFKFNSEVFGSGVAHISLAFFQAGRTYEIVSVRYDFQAAAVPEPATLLLLGTGLAGVAARYRRRKGRIKED